MKNIPHSHRARISIRISRAHFYFLPFSAEAVNTTMTSLLRAVAVTLWTAGSGLVRVDTDWIKGCSSREPASSTSFLDVARLKASSIIQTAIFKDISSPALTFTGGSLRWKEVCLFTHIWPLYAAKLRPLRGSGAFHCLQGSLQLCGRRRPNERRSLAHWKGRSKSFCQRWGKRPL